MLPVGRKLHPATQGVQGGVERWARQQKLRHIIILFRLIPNPMADKELLKPFVTACGSKTNIII